MYSLFLHKSCIGRLAYAFNRICLIVAAFLCVVSASAQHHSRDQQTLLIIDSYYENCLWSKSIIVPVSQMLSSVDSVHCEMVHLNNLVITDSISFQAVSDRIFSLYVNKHPRYVVMIGALAMNLRQRIKQEWGDIPILLISRTNTFSDLDYYFSGTNTDALLNSPVHMMRELRPEYNFTMVLVPDLYKETVDLMVHMTPAMDELVFFADQMYLNRNLAYHIRNYLAATYPNIKFNWVVAKPETANIFQNYLIYPYPQSGLLMSTWYYQRENSFGYPSLTQGKLNLISSSVNPFFSLRESYLEVGSIGGVYPNYDLTMEHINEVIGHMLEGDSMLDIPFYEDNSHQTIINYPILNSLGINKDLVPKNAVYIDKPPTFWEKYHWQIIILAIVIAAFSFILITRWRSLREKARQLQYRTVFINTMPVPYSRAVVSFLPNGNVHNIAFTTKNQAFEYLIQQNAVPDTPYILFTPKFATEKVEQLKASNGLIAFHYYFENSDSYYEFIFCHNIDTHERLRRGSNNYTFDVFAMDITSSRKMEVSLKETSEKLNLALSVAKMTAWQWDIKSDILSFDSESTFSPLLENIVPGKNRNEQRVPYNSFLAILHPEDVKDSIHIRSQIINLGMRSFSSQHRVLKSKDNPNDYEWIEIHGIVTDYYSDMSPKTITGSLQVITQRKEEERRMAEAIQRANESDKLKSAFLANMSHEIRTPLNAIIGFSSLITETDDRNKQREFANIILRNNDILLTLVDDVLDLAKIESNTIDINESPTDINALMRAIERSTSVRITSGVTLNLVLGASRCIAVLDGNRVQQVLVNLLSNAIKFTPKGSINFGYEITPDQNLYFFVKDSGIGIPPESQQVIFERFQKLDNFKQGTGLGLSICQTLVNKMSGEIGVKSRGLGKGSLFWFTIPFVPADASEGEIQDKADKFDLGPTKQTPQQSSQQSSQQTPQQSSQPTPQPTISDSLRAPSITSESASSSLPLALVAEDNDSNFKLIEHLLHDRFRILHAENGQEAVNLFCSENPDLIIMDINMPVLDGYGAVAQIREVSDSVPIIGVTAYAYASDKHRILQSGFNAYVPKPVSRTLLFEAIDKVMK